MSMNYRLRSGDSSKKITISEGHWYRYVTSYVSQADMLIQGVFVIHILFFFSSRRRHTRFDCDWSSDVCSSDYHGQASLIMIVEGHLAHRAVVLDPGQGVANLGPVGAAGCLDGLGQQMNRFPMHIGVIVGSLAIFGFELLYESQALRSVPCRQPRGGLHSAFERL